MKPPGTLFGFPLKSPLFFFALLSALSPLCLLAGFYCYVLAAFLHLGHWPSYGNPDPKQMGWWIPHVALQLGFATIPMAPLAAICLTIAGRIRNKDFPIWRVIGIAILCTGIAFLILRTDPGEFVDWFWD